MRNFITYNLVALVALALLALGACNGCGGTPYKKLARGYLAVNYSARLAEQFDSALQKYVAGQRAACKAKHAIKTPEYDKCVLPAVRLARAWTGKKAGQPTGKGILPALQSAQKVTRLGLDTAYDYIKGHEEECKKEGAPAKCTGDWKKTMKPALCGLSELVDRAIKLGAYKATGDATYKTVMALVKTMACPASN